MSDTNCTWVIYDHPSDYPNHFVVREWFILPGGDIKPAQQCKLADTLEEARRHVPWGKYNVGRVYEVDPAILEVWI